MTYTWNRIATVFDSNTVPLFSVIINHYRPDCFKWDLLEERGWKVFITGSYNYHD